MIIDYYSERGIELISCESLKDYLTVENYGKWYTLYIVSPENNTIKPLYFGELEGFVKFPKSAWCDHAVNPLAVVGYVEKHGLVLGNDVLNVILDRWLTDYCDGEVTKIIEYIPNGHKYITYLEFREI